MQNSGSDIEIFTETLEGVCKTLQCEKNYRLKDQLRKHQFNIIKKKKVSIANIYIIGSPRQSTMAQVVG